MAIPLIERPMHRNVEVYKDMSWERTYTFQGIDFTGCSAKGEVREKPNMSSKLLITLVVTFPATNQMTIAVDKNESNVSANEGYWAVVITDAGGKRFPWMAGTMVFRQVGVDP